MQTLDANKFEKFDFGRKYDLIVKIKSLETF